MIIFHCLRRISVAALYFASLAMYLGGSTGTIAHAGLVFGKRLDEVKPSFVIYGVTPGQETVDDPKHGFSAVFIDALISAAANEDIAITARRARANLKHLRITPMVVDLLEESVNLKTAKGAKKALLIAVEKYERGALSAPVHDAKRLDELLQAIGYQTELLIDPDRQTITQSVVRFAESLEPNGQAVLYFSGRGVDLSGAPHLIATDIGAKTGWENDTQFAVPFEKVHDEIAKKVGNAVFILDIDRTEFGSETR